jgi:TfoX/Sxy family transcriptional regulator of competence genes
MAQRYLNQLQELISTIGGGHNVVCKHFFSGAALYVERRICASLTSKGLAFKLSKSRCDDLFTLGKAIPLRYFDRSPVKQGYILLPDFQDLSDADISSFLEECISYATSADAGKRRGG